MILNSDNYRSYAASHYQNISCMGRDEFLRDLSIANKINTQFTRIVQKDEKGNVRLLINHVITFFNVFDFDAAKNLLFFLTNEEHKPRLKATLITLNRLKHSEYNEVDVCPIIQSLVRKEL